MISIILVEPAVAGNIGAVARAMANFNFTELVLVRPKCAHLDDEAQSRSKHAKDILTKAIVTDTLPDDCTLIGTTSVLGRDFNIPRTPVTPKQLVKLVQRKKANIGLVFGPEGPGLSNKDIEACDFIVTIPTHKDYDSMNLSHSVAIILYELYDALGTEKVNAHQRTPEPAQIKQALKMAQEAVSTLNFLSDEKREVQRLIWKKVITRLFLTKRELSSVMGFFRKVIDRK
jgi:tRNA/rRNA methyltransferase